MRMKREPVPDCAVQWHTNSFERLERPVNKTVLWKFGKRVASTWLWAWFKHLESVWERGTWYARFWWDVTHPIPISVDFITFCKQLDSVGGGKERQTLDPQAEAWYVQGEMLAPHTHAHTQTHSMPLHIQKYDWYLIVSRHMVMGLHLRPITLQMNLSCSVYLLRQCEQHFSSEVADLSRLSFAFRRLQGFN